MSQAALDPSALEARILAAVASLDPRRSGGRVSFTCPQCSSSGRTAYAYLDNRSGQWRCNRLNDCGASGRLWDRASLAPAPRRSSPPSPTPRPDDRRLSRILSGARGLSKGAAAYLASRLPGLDLARLEGLAREVGCFDLAQLGWPDQDAAGVRGLVKGGYELVCGLYALDTGALVSVQGRSIGAVQAGAPKLLSSKGGYGEAGACFGSLRAALEESEQAGRLVVVEGLVDYLTARAAGVRAVVGVPGAGLARKVARELVARGWRGRLLVSLDGDDAGARGLADIEAELKGSGVEVGTARPSTGDINDIWRGAGEAGARAVRSHFDQALERLAHDPIRALPTTRLTWRGRNRARVLFVRHRTARNSARRSLGMTGICGALHLTRRLVAGADDVVGSIRKTGVPVCERAGCVYCRRQQWPHIVAFAREHWPDEVSLATVPVEDKRAIGKLRAKLSKRARGLAEGDERDAYLTSADPVRGVLIVVATAGIAGAVESVVGPLESVSKERALCELAQGFMGSAVIAAEELNGSRRVDELENDEWIASRARWATWAGKGLPLPSASKVVKEARSEAKAKAKARDADPIPKDCAEVYVYQSHDQTKLLALTVAPLSPASRMSILLGERLDGLDPADPGNLLDNPDIAGPAVEDWIRRFYRHHTGEELVPRGRGIDKPPRKGPGAEDVYWRLRGPLEELRLVIER